MEFLKMHGLGNDFILLTDGYDYDDDFSHAAPLLCNRHTGIGADGIILAAPSNQADIRMRIINADGSEAEMCGNGIRCFASYAYDQALVTKKVFTIETLAGIMKASITTGMDGRAWMVRINMGKPFLERSLIPMEGPDGPVIAEPVDVNGRTYTISSLLMGVPHTVTFVDDLAAIDIHVLGPQFENHRLFPRKTNMNFVQVVDDHTIKVRTWERGAGMTLACGTGSCAAVVASYLNGLTGRNVDVQLLLGTLHIEYDENAGFVYMTGPASTVFKGEWR